jgi:hypothetical protein
MAPDRATRQPCSARATKRFPFVQAENNKQAALSITETDNSTYINECCRVGLPCKTRYRVRTLSRPLTRRLGMGRAYSPPAKTCVHSQVVHVEWWQWVRFCFEYIRFRMLTIIIPHMLHVHSSIRGEKTAQLDTTSEPQPTRRFKRVGPTRHVLKFETSLTVAPVVGASIYICRATLRCHNSSKVIKILCSNARLQSWPRNLLLRLKFYGIILSP